MASAKATIETCDAGPCLAVRNGAVWTQFPRLPEGPLGKFVLVIGRGSSERVWADEPLQRLRRAAK